MEKNEYGYTEEEWDNLEDFEREAIMEEPEGAAGVEEPEANSDNEPEAQVEGSEENSEPENNDATDEAEEEAEDDQGGSDEDTPTRDDSAQTETDADDSDTSDAQDKAYVPTLRVQVPDDIDQQLEEIAAEKKKLRALYNDGEIDADEYESQKDELDEKRFSLRESKFKAQIANEMRESRWLDYDVPQFLAQNPQYKQGTTLFRMLDERVKDLQAKLAADGKDPLNPSVLQQADRELREELAKELGLKVESGNKGKTGRVPPSRNAPPTLANVPAADIEDTNGGKWAALDRLAETDPEAYEERLARMPEAELNDYLQASTR